MRPSILLRGRLRAVGPSQKISRGEPAPCRRTPSAVPRAANRLPSQEKHAPRDARWDSFGVSIGPGAFCTKAVPLRRAGPLSPGMSSEQPIPDDADAWRPLQSPEEREALVLEFQRLAARLVQEARHGEVIGGQRADSTLPLGIQNLLDRYPLAVHSGNRSLERAASPIRNRVPRRPRGPGG